MIDAAIMTATMMIAAQPPVGEHQVSPHTPLLQAYERFGTVLCKAPKRRERMKWIELRYRKRLKAVRDKVAGQYGAEAADRGYISVNPCYVFKSEAEIDRAMNEAHREFQAELKNWEVRYDLRTHK